jgi:flagellum-specific ATP synthase
VGKSTLLGAMVRHCRADVAVVALIGERGREVEEFVHRTLGADGLRRAVVVAATSADPPVVRVRGALYAMTIAEHFRALGCNVLLVMDSVTRFAMAMREVGLSVGEPPTTKGYTASVFAALPRLLERAGTSAGEGAITGVFTVLVEGDDLSDPIADAARAILDGHIVLSRRLAERGHFPAIDVSQSVSRVMPQLVSAAHLELAQRARELLASYREAEDLLAVGAYKRGGIARLDEALDRMPMLERFLRHGLDAPADPEKTLAMLKAIWETK